MNQCSTVPIGTDATLLAGYAQSANERLGPIDFVYENTGANSAYVKVGQYDGVSSPSGYAQVGDAFTIVPGGTVTKSYVLLGKKIGFFGSGSTTLNISASMRNKADLRGGQIDIVPTATRKGWGLDAAADPAALTRKWGSVSAVSTSGNSAAGNGNISPTGPNYDQTQTTK